MAISYVAAQGKEAYIGILPAPVGHIVGTGSRLSAYGYSEGASLSWDTSVETQEAYGSDGLVVGGTTETSFEVTMFVVQDAGNVSFINVGTPGSGYTSAPSVTIAAPPGGGRQATAVAIVAPGGTIAGVFITDHGKGYTSAPSVTFTGGGGTGAAATATLNGQSDRNLFRWIRGGDLSVVFGPAGNSTGYTSYTFPATVESGAIEPAVSGVISIPLTAKAGAVTEGFFS